MITVEVPDAVEWPEWAVEVACIYRARKDEAATQVQTFKTIPRPIPVWTPTLGDWVFINLHEHPGMVGKIIRELAGDFELDYPGKTSNHWAGWGLVDPPYIKPFDPLKYGKKWDEI